MNQEIPDRERSRTRHSMPKVLGLIVNPIAGMGGSVALHGTDGSAHQLAIKLGAVPVAGIRTDRALARLALAVPDVKVLAAPGVMGEDLARAHALSTDVVEIPVGDITTAGDTQAAACAMVAAGVTLLMFAGGDGTARDIVAETGTDLPVLGIPAGVKMHSGVFGTTPEAAGDIAARFFISPENTPLLDVEVLDVKEESQLQDRLNTQFISTARVPYAPDKVQRTKASPVVANDSALEALCQELAEEMLPNRYYIIGPGTTTAKILTALSITGTLTGVDVIRDRALVASDASEQSLLALLSDGTPTSIILGVIGGQGFLLGRGNQQISQQVLGFIEDDEIVIVANEEKLISLDPPVLRVDFGGEPGSATLIGYRRVRTGPRTTTMLKVVG